MTGAYKTLDEKVHSRLGAKCGPETGCCGTEIAARAYQAGERPAINRRAT